MADPPPHPLSLPHVHCISLIPHPRLTHRRLSIVTCNCVSLSKVRSVEPPTSLPAKPATQQGGSRQRRTTLESRIPLPIPHHTPHTATLHCFAFQIRTLISRGLAVDSAPFDHTMLHMACAQGNVYVAELLLYHGADIHKVMEPDGVRPIEVAAYMGHAEVVCCLRRAVWVVGFLSCSVPDSGVRFFFWLLAPPNLQINTLPSRQRAVQTIVCACGPLQSLHCQQEGKLVCLDPVVRILVLAWCL